MSIEFNSLTDILEEYGINPDNNAWLTHSLAEKEEWDDITDRGPCDIASLPFYPYNVFEWRGKLSNDISLTSGVLRRYPYHLYTIDISPFLEFCRTSVYNSADPFISLSNSKDNLSIYYNPDAREFFASFYEGMEVTALFTCDPNQYSECCIIVGIDYNTKTPFLAICPSLCLPSKEEVDNGTAWCSIYDDSIQEELTKWAGKLLENNRYSPYTDIYIQEAPNIDSPPQVTYQIHPAEEVTYTLTYTPSEVDITEDIRDNLWSDFTPSSYYLENRVLTYQVTRDLSISANPHYKILTVTKDGVNIPPENGRYTESLTIADKGTEIVVESAPLPKYTLTVEKEGQGTITPSNSSFELEEGESKSFTISPQSGYLLASVKLNDTPISPVSGNRYTISIDQNSTLSVLFTRILKSVEFKADGITTDKLLETSSLSSPYIKGDGTIVTTHFVENEYLTINNEKYLKIFDHNVSANPSNQDLYFLDANEAKYCFKPNKFSRLGDLNSSLFKGRSDNKYQFLLRYPNKLKIYSADTNEDTTIKVDWKNDLYLEFDVYLSSTYQNTRRMICSNYPGTKVTNQKHFSIELTGTNEVGNSTVSGRLRVQINDAFLLSSDNQVLSPGHWKIIAHYTASDRMFKITANNGTTKIELSKAVSDDIYNSELPEYSLYIGSSDLRNQYSQEANPFNPISIALIPTNIWKQSFNPLGEYPGDDDASGYETISLNMTSEWGTPNTNDRGLGLNTYAHGLLDCQPSFGNWYGSIGQYDYWEDVYGNSGLPAPDRKGYYQVQLWVKVDNTSYDAYTAIQKTVNNEYILYSNNFEEKLMEET